MKRVRFKNGGSIDDVQSAIVFNFQFVDTDGHKDMKSFD